MVSTQLLRWYPLHFFQPRVLGPGFLARPLDFAQELGTRAVHRQIHRSGTGAVGPLYSKCLLGKPAAVLKSGTFLNRHAQQAPHQAQTFAQGQSKQAFDAPADLDGGIGEGVLASAPTGAYHRVQPAGQRFSGRQHGVVRSPIGGFEAAPGALGFTLAPRTTSPGLLLCATKPSETV